MATEVHQRARSQWTPMANIEKNSKMFAERQGLILKWNERWNDEQRMRVIKDLLQTCKFSQIEMLHNELHSVMPVYRADPLVALPRHISMRIFSYLDPRSLSRCSRVSWIWKSVAESDLLWMSKCLRLGWTLQFPPTPFEVGAWKRFYIENFIYFQESGLLFLVSNRLNQFFFHPLRTFQIQGIVKEPNSDGLLASLPSGHQSAIGSAPGSGRTLGGSRRGSTANATAGGSSRPPSAIGHASQSGSTVTAASHSLGPRSGSKTRPHGSSSSGVWRCPDRNPMDTWRFNYLENSGLPLTRERRKLKPNETHNETQRLSASLLAQSQERTSRAPQANNVEGEPADGGELSGSAAEHAQAIDAAYNRIRKTHQHQPRREEAAAAEQAAGEPTLENERFAAADTEGEQSSASLQRSTSADGHLSGALARSPSPAPQLRTQEPPTAGTSQSNSQRIGLPPFLQKRPAWALPHSLQEQLQQQQQQQQQQQRPQQRPQQEQHEQQQQQSAPGAPPEGGGMPALASRPPVPPTSNALAIARANSVEREPAAVGVGVGADSGGGDAQPEAQEAQASSRSTHSHSSNGRARRGSSSSARSGRSTAAAHNPNPPNSRVNMTPTPGSSRLSERDGGGAVWKPLQDDE